MQWMKFSWITTPKTPLSHLTYVYRDCKDFLSASCYSISYASISHIRSMNCIWQNFTVHAGWSLLHQLVHSQNIYENDGQLINQTCTCVSFCHCGVLYNFLFSALLIYTPWLRPQSQINPVVKRNPPPRRPTTLTRLYQMKMMTMMSLLKAHLQKRLDAVNLCTVQIKRFS